MAIWAFAARWARQTAARPYLLRWAAQGLSADQAWKALGDIKTIAFPEGLYYPLKGVFYQDFAPLRAVTKGAEAMRDLAPTTRLKKEHFAPSPWAQPERYRYVVQMQPRDAQGRFLPKTARTVYSETRLTPEQAIADAEAMMYAEGDSPEEGVASIFTARLAEAYEMM